MGDSFTLRTEHIYGFNVNGIRLVIMDKSYARCFRRFWSYFMNYDLNKTIETIEKAGIRTFDSEYFVSKSGGKKKNIFVKEGYWIYTHLNAEAMKRTYEKFLSEWEGKAIEVDTLNDCK